MRLKESILLPILILVLTCSCVLKAAELSESGPMGNQVDPEINQLPELAGVSLTPEKTVLKPGEEFSLLLQTEIHTIYFGEPYALERYNEGEWQQVFPGPDQVWILPLYSLSPGPGRVLQIKAPDEPGLYRYVKELTDYSGREKNIITAQFRVFPGE